MADRQYKYRQEISQVSIIPAHDTKGTVGGLQRAHGRVKGRRVVGNGCQVNEGRTRTYKGHRGLPLVAWPSMPHPQPWSPSLSDDAATMDVD